MTGTSIIDLFINASLIVQFVIVLLLLASLFSWMVIFERWLYIQKSEEELSNFEDIFWSDIGIEKVLQLGREEGHIPLGVESIFHSGYLDYKRYKKQNLEPDVIMEGVQRSMRVALNKEQNLLEKNLPFLATVASASPYVGLFGTVWGIMNSFRSLVEANQATLTSVAPGISEALIATAVGLFAAIPALIAYNRFTSKIDSLLSFYESFVEEFSSVLHREEHKNKV